ncbi:MAG TPA: DUF1214 domain-containing protein [Polyangiaceae bacterium]|nr:DUF1214 domain-containing protein [Polyangiaceae bacterium]
MESPKIDDATRRIMDGAAWNEFCDALKAAGTVVTSDISPSDPFQRAEGYRYLTRLLRAALETFVEDADPMAPELLRTCHETIKMGADNPDNYYQNAPINGKYEYRLFGKRGTVHYLGFGTQEGNYGASGSLDTSGYLDASQLVTDADGCFEIAVSAEKRPDNWLPMTAKSRTLIVRQTFLDRSHETPAELKIERVGGRHVPRPLTPQSIDRGLVASAKFVEGCARLFNQWAHGFKARINELPLFDPKVATAAGGVPHIAYYHGYWRLQPDEALVIEVVPPDCDYWNFQLNNHWMESLDYRYHTITINRHSAKLRPDGSVRVIVAHRDPGAGNWIDTASHSEGTMCWRWVRAAEHPQPMTRVVKLEDL